MSTKLILSAILICAGTFGFAQNITQNVKGTVTDKISGAPLPGVVVAITDLTPAIGSSTDLDGHFKITGVPIGKHVMVISYVGYKEAVLQSVVVNSGKEVDLNITLEEDLQQTEAVEITAKKNQREALNNMSTVSTRTFSVEETQKFAAAINDPGRMAASYAGVISTDDGNNSISIRGNSPYGLLWRMEGVDIPSPNHFASPASSGGGISIISSQLLANSDFSSGAFAAEYGNALSGVFDLKLRKGNSEKREYTLQAGFLGLDLAAEGPFKKGYAGSYLINYRLSTLSLIQNIGIDLGDDVTNFQDLSYNIYLPTEKAGQFSLFGFAGLSNQSHQARRDTTLWAEDEYYKVEDNYYANTIMNGLKHVFPFNEKTYLQTSVIHSDFKTGYKSEELNYDFAPQLHSDQLYHIQKSNLNAVINHKFNAKHSVRGGIYFNHYNYLFEYKELNEDLDEIKTLMDDKNTMNTFQSFAQWRYRISEPWTLNLGVHYLRVLDNNTQSIEPRAALKFSIDEIQSVSLGYGLHGQMQPLGVYSVQIEDESGTSYKPNKNLDLNKAHHIVLGYDRSITKFMYVKLEGYYQHLFNIAIENDLSRPYSTINNEYDYVTEKLVNEGIGRNYGLELTLEQSTHKNMYFLLSGSLFQSEYQGIDKIWRNTRYNTNYALVFTGGKEWKVGKDEKNKTLGLNIRTTFVGGLRNTPINEAASIAAGETIRYEDQLYEGRNPNYFRTDIKLSLKRNFKRMTTTLSLDIQNATNTKTVYGSYFDAEAGKVREYYNLPLIPVLAYRMEF
jgi:CarboxypepD_reg-like domain/TonB-dependent Receptor Plug Domain